MINYSQYDTIKTGKEGAGALACLCLAVALSFLAPKYIRYCDKNDLNLLGLPKAESVERNYCTSNLEKLSECGGEMK